MNHEFTAVKITVPGWQMNLTDVDSAADLGAWVEGEASTLATTATDWGVELELLDYDPAEDRDGTFYFAAYGARRCVAAFLVDLFTGGDEDAIDLVAYFEGNALVG